MRIDGNQLRPGMLIEYKSRLWAVVKGQHVKPGKGGAFMQVELKDIRDGTKLNERFRSEDTLERVRLDEEEYQFLFTDGAVYTFMHTQNFEQMEIPSDQVGDAAAYLKEGMLVKITTYEGELIGVVLPETVVLEITEAEPVVKGQTASSSYKPAVLENGVRIMVPPHIESGTRVVVNTADGTYVERAKD